MTRASRLSVRQVFTGATVIAVATVCVRLGLWQLSRLDERRQRNASIESRLSEPEVGFPPPGEASGVAFRRARAKGVWDYSRQVVVVGRPMQGIPGVHVVTPLRLDGGGAVLVERGWVPSPDARAVDLTQLHEGREGDSVAVEGVLIDPMGGSAAGTGWPIYVRGVNPDSVAARLPYDLLPFVVRRTGVPESGLPSLMRLVPLPEVTDGPHLTYAIQWFAFAVIAVVGGFALVLRQAKDLKTAADHH